MDKMKDIDIRNSLMDKLNMQNEGHDYLIIPEMVVCDGESRVDIAVANENLYGYEIKSDVDTLDRLEIQKQSYNRTFDKVFIVVGSKFEKIISEHVPDWWGIYVAYYDKNKEVKIKERKRGRKNENVSAEALLELLWREEVATLLKQYGVKSISGKNRRILRKMAIDNIPFEIIRNYTRETLKSRTEWR